MSIIPRTRWTRPAVAVLAALSLALAACGGGGAAGSGSGSELSLVAFSVPKPAYDDLQKDFAETPEGKGVTWKSSYGASGDQARAVISGLPADYVGFSLQTDMTKLVDEDLVAADWDQGPNKGIVSTSVVTIVVRKGNPLGITGWDDLIKPGVEIVTPNPGSSGSARWNVLAAWSHITANGGSEAEATEYLTKYYQNIVSLPSSGREATSAFTSGTGDVLISYENEAIAARQSGAEVDYVLPDTTLKIENPGAVTTKAPESAKKFLDYVVSDEGQKVFASHGFRPLDDSVDPGTVEGAKDPAKPFPTVGKLVTIEEFGGWSEAAKKFFAEDTGIVSKIQDASGVS
ncbi:sulfate transport system substrate-binding protein [Friedmanniella luteola]|uniref:Sulfate transport system substrate-binding protein n=1 Tax=Friedmanniella luteola TaxID=546871 RepID=A0A1H1WH86_9ACTN|nr:sulfate ABC transporter substrate-binding protein [Friedmanniella luteola]SDS95991.1 sulfate transport system substrate-binding protein [Friedmanniella luteola]